MSTNRILIPDELTTVHQERVWTLTEEIYAPASR